MNNTISKIKKYCPVWTLIVLGFALLSLILHIAIITNEGFADWHNNHTAFYIRWFLAKITGIFPFSLAEIVVATIPVWFVLAVIFIIKVSKQGIVKMIRLACSMLAVLMIFYSLYVLMYAAGFNNPTLDLKMEFDKQPVSAKQLQKTAVQLTNEINKLVDKIEYEDKSFSKMPYSLDEMNKRLIGAYKNASEKYSFIKTFSSRFKPIILSEPLTYTHISGIYSYLTGESNINTNFPDYTLPYTAAHELAHQRGFSREDEANFIAFLVCSESDDDYIKYSGYVGMYEYVVSALNSASRDMYLEIGYDLDIRVRYEMQAYNDFFEKYRGSVASKISGAVNDTVIKIQGDPDGEKSYGLTVDLAVAYYKNLGLLD